MTMPRDYSGKGRRPLAAVDCKDISVVIQGPLYRGADPARTVFTCIASIKKHLPHAEVIISTWQQEDVLGLEVDRILLLDHAEAGVDFSERFLSNAFPLKTLYKAADIEGVNGFGLKGYRRRMASIL